MTIVKSATVPGVSSSLAELIVDSVQRATARATDKLLAALLAILAQVVLIAIVIVYLRAGRTVTTVAQITAIPPLIHLPGSTIPTPVPFQAASAPSTEILAADPANELPYSSEDRQQTPMIRKTVDPAKDVQLAELVRRAPKQL